jgi:hypothetical protein
MRLKHIFILLFFTSFFFTPLSFSGVGTSFNIISAAEIKDYTLLAPIPIDGQLTQKLTADEIFQKYIPGMFNLIIGLVAVLAMARIIWGGILYISTDAIQGKSDGKKMIIESIWGLVLISTAWIILYTINPKLVDLNLSISSTPTTESVASRSVCTNCEPMIGVPFSRSVAGGINGTPELGAALKAFTSEYQKDIWWVTEGNPPTIQHSDPCHSSGTCVDANFIPGSVASPASKINSFVETAKKQGLVAVYEVTDSLQKNALKLVGVKEEYIMINPKATGSHFHIKLP